jgi:hypothetical protein
VSISNAVWLDFVIILYLHCKSIINNAQRRHLLPKKQCPLLLEAQSLLFMCDAGETKLYIWRLRASQLQLHIPSVKQLVKIQKMPRKRVSKAKKKLLLMFHLPSLVKQIHHHLEWFMLLGCQLCWTSAGA